MDRREFLKATLALELALVTGLSLEQCSDAEKFYEFDPLGNLTILFIADSHAHLRPIYYREPSLNLAPANMTNTPGHIVGKDRLKYWNINSGTKEAYFQSYLDFPNLAKKYGKMGGYAHLSTLSKQIMSDRGKDRCLFLDSGDTWVGTGIGLLTEGEALVEAQNLLGIDVMSPHWEFTFGQDILFKRIKQLKADFVCQNVVYTDFEKEGDKVFKEYVIKQTKDVKVGIIGQSFPYVPLAHPRTLEENNHISEGWSFGIRPSNIQRLTDKLKNEDKVDIVIVLSHNGLEVDKKIAKEVKGIDLLITGHTHDPLPKALKIGNTILVQAGSHGKFLGRIDLDVQNKKIANFRHKLLPVLSNFIPPDPKMQELIDKWHKPYEVKLYEKLAVTESLLYRRDTFMGTFDQLIVEAIKDTYDPEIVFSPGYRWGTTLLPGDEITMKDVYDHTSITYPNVWTFDMQGEQLWMIFEDILDNLFNSDPYKQQGGDFSRLLGVEMSIKINAPVLKRIPIESIKIDGKAFNPKKLYKISAWGGNLYRAGSNLRQGAKPVYDVVRDYLKKKGKVRIEANSGIKYYA